MEKNFFLTILLKKKISFFFINGKGITVYTFGVFWQIWFFFTLSFFQKWFISIIVWFFFLHYLLSSSSFVLYIFLFIFFRLLFHRETKWFPSLELYDYPHTVRDVDTFTSMVVKKGNDTTNLACKKKKRIFYVNRPHLFFSLVFYSSASTLTYILNHQLNYYCTLKDLLCQVVAVDYNIGGIVVG